ncbi:hypothetical protein DFH08DRAFT_809875 [Mycena albidolilacea]|uniref:Uncharacterized protein n=1 Tax=Mycena albidolilacea TaxID=1033008 RepID=A0AAD7ER82_9AGAR|nr:hypothetical protein DFH08DRAFT_809875 [Mycena albidolilacea]
MDWTPRLRRKQREEKGPNCRPSKEPYRELRRENVELLRRKKDSPPRRRGLIPTQWREWIGNGDDIARVPLRRDQGNEYGGEVPLLQDIRSSVDEVPFLGEALPSRDILSGVGEVLLPLDTGRNTVHPVDRRTRRTDEGALLPDVCAPRTDPSLDGEKSCHAGVSPIDGACLLEEGRLPSDRGARRAVLSDRSRLLQSNWPILPSWEEWLPELFGMDRLESTVDVPAKSLLDRLTKPKTSLLDRLQSAEDVGNRALLDRMKIGLKERVSTVVTSGRRRAHNRPQKRLERLLRLEEDIRREQEEFRWTDVEVDWFIDQEEMLPEDAKEYDRMDLITVVRSARTRVRRPQDTSRRLGIHVCPPPQVTVALPRVTGPLTKGYRLESRNVRTRLVYQQEDHERFAIVVMLAPSSQSVTILRGAMRRSTKASQECAPFWD